MEFFEFLELHYTAIFSVHANEETCVRDYLQGTFAITILASSTTWAKPSNTYYNHEL